MKENLLKSKILIVDDTPANIEVLESLLIHENFVNFISTTDSREVMDIYLKFEPDLILLDLNMPYLSGFEVMEQLMQLVNDKFYLPILVLTADASDHTKKKALETGASDFLSKPFDLVEVSLRIKNLLYTNFLYTQLRNHNEILENKVRERTLEIELTNNQLQLALKKAEAANKLKESFINNISHEIRTPLNGIIGFAHLMADESVSTEEKTMYAEIIQESSTRLINTITSFIDISLLNSGNIEISESDFLPEVLLFEIFDKYKSDFSVKNIHFQYDTSNIPENLMISADENLVGKVLEKLVENALKFTSEGQVITGADLENNEIVFFVKDTGVGISDEFKNRIFKGFNQENEELTRGFEGVGLGLGISKGLVDLMGGKIWYNSTKGKGSEFYFSIPLKIVNSEPGGSESELIKPKDKIKSKILVVEDDDINYYLIYFLLSNQNVELLHASDGLQAIEKFNENPDISVVLMDLKLPGLNGFDVTKKIKSINAQVPIIAVTSYSGIDDSQKALQAGCSDFIIKPVNKTVLFDVIGKYISLHELVPVIAGNIKH
jgi:two-component system, sensor histidine kinase and response regulator